MSLIRFSGLSHILATVARDIVIGAKAVESAIARAKGSEQVIEALTGVIDPMALPIERAAFALLGKVTAAAHDLQPAVLANGLSITLDSAEVADLKAVIAYLTSHPLAKVQSGA